MKFIFQETMNAPGKPHNGRLRHVVPATLAGIAATCSPRRPRGAIAVHAGRCIHNRFQKCGEPYPEINWKKLESKFHFARRKARRA
jgi:hypothetical protein